jgi:hypothetical protein
MARHAAELVLIAVTGIILSTLCAAAALIAPLRLYATPADRLLLRTHHHTDNLNQPRQQLFENAIGTAAPIVKGNVGTWHTAQLRVARGDLSATSLPSQGLALFAGGFTPGALLSTCARASVGIVAAAFVSASSVVKF